MGLYSKYKNFDLLKIPISLSYKKKYLYKTFIGATLTIIGFVLIISFFIFKLTKIINKSLFTLISNEFQNPKGFIDFTNIPILFALADSNGNPLELNSQIFEFSVVLSEYIQNYDIYGNSYIINSEKEIEIERCDNLTDIIDFSYFSEYNISNFKCIKPNQNITINGTFGDITTGFKSLKIYIKRCNKKIKNCFTNQYINSYINNSKLAVVYLGYKTDFYNSKKKDIENAIFSRSITLSPFFIKKVFYYMTLVQYELYDNLFLNNKKEYICFRNKETFIEFNPNFYFNNTENNDIFAFFSFVYDGNMYRYTKSVEKFGEIFSYIGNFFNIMLTFFKIINNYFSNKILFIDIFYSFFFEDKFKKKEKNVHFDNSRLYILVNKKLNNSKLNLKTQEKSINSNLNLNSLIVDKNVDKKIDININDNNENYDNNNKDENNQNNNKVGLKRILTNRTRIIEKEKIVFKKDSKLYILCPLWFIKNKKNLKHLAAIKDSICNAFSLENFVEFNKLKKNVNNLQRENQDLFEGRKIHLSDKNIRAEINKILNNK